MNEDVIVWLRSPEGEKWSAERHKTSLVTFQPMLEYPGVPGFFNLKPQRGGNYSASLHWGSLPGDEKLEAEAWATDPWR